MKFLLLFVFTIAVPLALAQDAEGTTAAPGTTPAPVSIIGTYELSSSDKFDEYMVALDVGFWTRTMANAATPVSTISKDGDEYTVKTETTFKTTIIKFKLGEEFDETTGDGRACKSTITVDGAKMLTNQVCGGKEYKIDREFSPTEMKMILYVPGVVCTRIYRRL